MTLNGLIERNEPIARLNELAILASQGRGAIALISGEAGIGKTSMLRSFADAAADSVSIKWGASDPLHTPRVLGPVYDMQRDLGAIVQNILTHDPTSNRLFPAIRDELESSPRTTVMVFEDAHWADNATLDLLKSIGRRIAHLKAILVISYRSDEVDPKHPLSQVIGDFPQAQTERIQLTPISPSGVSELARNAGRSDQNLHAVTNGNPFFVTELLATPSCANPTVPASIQDAVGSRLNRLNDTQRTFLETISVIPYAVEADFLAQLLGKSSLDIATDCVRRFLLTYSPNGLYRFRHELARLGTKERLALPDQQKIHEQILTVLLSNGGSNHPEKIVFHALSANSADLVLQFAPLAAHNAAKSGAHREAAAHLATALQFVHFASTELAATLHENWSYEAGLIQIDNDVITARHQALEIWRQLGRPDKIGENLRWLSRLHWYQGESDIANDFADQAVAVLENAAPSAERALAYSLKSQFNMLNDRMQEAVMWGKKALSVEQEHESIEVRVHACANIGTALLFRDDIAGESFMHESLTLALNHELHEHAARVYTNLADYAVGARRFELAEKTTADGIVFDTDHDLDSWTYHLVGFQALLRLEQGRLAQAQTIARGVMSLDHQTMLMKLPALLVLSKVRMRTGESDAEQLLDQALSNALKTGEVQYIIPARIGLIELAWLTNQPDAALTQLKLALQENSAPLSTWRNVELALWSYRYGCLPPTCVISELPEPCRLEIEGKSAQAAKAWQVLGSPYGAAMALMQSKQTGLSATLSQAMAILSEIGATGAVSKIKQLALQSNINTLFTKPDHDPLKSSSKHPLGLTLREQQIFPLVLDGRSNKEISDLLSRSPRTIENHVSSILRKLNVTNRMQAMLRVKNEPWLSVQTPTFQPSHDRPQERL